MLAALAFILLMNLMNRMAGGGPAANDKMARFGEARTQSLPTGSKKVTFQDVAGADEEKEELEEIVEFLRDPEKYTALGARIPKGVLLVGPPGTGKTLLAKAVAGEAGVPFSPSPAPILWRCMWAWAPAASATCSTRRRSTRPSIIFIDEIDAVGRQRGSGLGGGHDEREQTLNQLLVEMDGFAANEGVIVLAATNRGHSRPGAAASRPVRPAGLCGPADIKGREEILKVHTRNKPLAEDVIWKASPSAPPALPVRIWRTW